MIINIPSMYTVKLLSNYFLFKHNFRINDIYKMSLQVDSVTTSVEADAVASENLNSDCASNIQKWFKLQTLIDEHTEKTKELKLQQKEFSPYIQDWMAQKKVDKIKTKYGTIKLQRNERLKIEKDKK